MLGICKLGILSYSLFFLGLQISPLLRLYFVVWFARPLPTETTSPPHKRFANSGARAFLTAIITTTVRTYGTIIG